MVQIGLRETWIATFTGMSAPRALCEEILAFEGAGGATFLSNEWSGGSLSVGIGITGFDRGHRLAALPWHS